MHPMSGGEMKRANDKGMKTLSGRHLFSEAKDLHE